MEHYSIREEEKKDERNAGLITLVIGVIIVILMIILPAFTQPDPLPEIPEVVMFEFGGSSGGGSTNSDAPSSSSSEAETPEPETNEAPPVETESVTETSQEVPVEAAEHADETPTEKPREVSNNTLYPGDKGDSNSQGGGGGSGDSDGEGDGDDEGAGVGEGGDGDYDLGGRGVMKKATLSGNFPQIGTVVVDIYVDRQGNVFNARVNRLKSDITNQDQINAAVNAAKKAKFTVKADAPPEQKGSITFHFEKS